MLLTIIMGLMIMVIIKEVLPFKTKANRVKKIIKSNFYCKEFGTHKKICVRISKHNLKEILIILIY